jgi:hypothetical protein
MHGGAHGSGGPKGPRNGNYKHGRYGHQPDDDPGESSHGEHEQQQKSPLRFVPMSKRWRSFLPDTALGAIVAVPDHLVQRVFALDCLEVCALVQRVFVVASAGIGGIRQCATA